MPIRVELCHVDSNRVVVRATEWHSVDEQSSALGEANNAEEAEDRARQRLASHLKAEDQDPEPSEGQSKPLPGPPKPAPKRIAKPDAPATNQAPATPAKSRSESSQPTEIVQHEEPVAQPPSEEPTDPEDWSEELAAIDIEVRRIGWDRAMEGIYLERAFGHGSRHRLTRYGDLVAFMRQLKGLPEGAKPDIAPVPIRRSDLLEQGNQMLATLNWSSDQARQFLTKEIGASSRQQLSDEQLLQFNMLLEEQTLKNSSVAAES